MQKSEKAKFTTNRLEGVRSALVVVNTYTTKPLPSIENEPNMVMANIKILCHNGFSGGHWYLRGQWPNSLRTLRVLRGAAYNPYITYTRIRVGLYTRILILKRSNFDSRRDRVNIRERSYRIRDSPDIHVIQYEYMCTRTYTYLDIYTYYTRIHTTCTTRMYTSMPYTLRSRVRIGPPFWIFFLLNSARRGTRDNLWKTTSLDFSALLPICPSAHLPTARYRKQIRWRV